MRKALLKFFAVYFVFMVIFIVEKPLFMAVYNGLYRGIGFADVLSVVWHGLSVDAAMAAYLTAVPGFLIMAMLTTRSHVIKVIEHIYFIFISVLLAAIAVVDLGLYGYWGFRLDATPVFYLFTSPAAAFASVTAAELIGGLLAWLALSAAFYGLVRITVLHINVQPLQGKKRTLGAFAMFLLTAALFIPIRGGFTVSTMNPSRAYFSTNARLNHAAMNPAFSFLYSVSHQNNFAAQFRFMEPAKAEQLFRSLRAEPEPSDSAQLLNCSEPDIWFIIAESFSAHLMPSLGGEDIAVRLDSIARNGLLFTQFYASSFRTDRALPAILSGFPGQPNTSVMKFVNKAEKLPSLSKVLGNAGYDTGYYYGGDINFTNMLAFLKNAGFEHIVRDKDFSIAQRTSKWGAHDSDLFSRVIADLKTDTVSSPRLRVIQTSSSHEPFEVPYKSRFDNKKLNAFAFADSCIGDFVDSLRLSPRWDRSLVVIVPDHYGVYPENLSGEQQRHHIPLVMTGGALRLKGTVDTPASQTDIAATILEACGLGHSEFTYSNNILNPRSPHFAFYTSPSAMGFVTATDTVEYNLDSNRAVELRGEAAKRSLESAKAYLQTIYDNLADL